MLFRVLTLCVSVLLVLAIFTEIIWPSIHGRKLFPLFRRESRLQRAERLRRHAEETKRAVEREAEALRVESEAAEADAEIQRRLTRP